jgi:outer membrane protein
MTPFLIFLAFSRETRQFTKGSGGLPSAVPLAQTPPPQAQPGQAPAAHPSSTKPQSEAPVTAFPNSPKMPPPRTQDIAVPPAPTTPGAMNGQTLPPLTADEAARIALRLQPSLGVQTGAIQVQQGHTIQTGAAEHPQVTLSAGYDNIQTLPGYSVPNSPVEAPTLALPDGASALYAFSITAAGRQLIYDFNMTRNLVRQSEALERSAKQDLTTAQLSLVLNVKTAFYDYLSAVRTVGVNESNVSNRQDQLNLATARLKNGIGEPSDVDTAQTSKSQGILQLNQARNAAEQARITLLQQMGVDPLIPVAATEESAPEPKEKDAHALTATAVKFRPEIKSAVEALAAARYGLSAARATDLPTIYAEIGAGLNGTTFPLTDNVASLAVGFQWPIFDGGIRRGAVKAAQGQISTANANLQTAVLQVRTDVASAYMAWKSADQRLMIGDNEVLNAREDVRVAEGRYRDGIGLFQDITTAQALLLGAQTDQESARNALDLARTQLQRATGELLQEIH